MKNYKLITVLKTFSKEEIKKFGKFLNSPYFNIKPYTLPFYKSLIKFYPEFSGNFSVENVWSKAYGNEKYNDTTCRKIMSMLFGYAEEFIKIEYASGNNIRIKIAAAQNYIARNLYSNAVNLLDEAESELLSSSVHDFELLTYLEGMRIYYNVQAGSQLKAAPHVFKQAEYILLDFINKYSDALYYAYMNNLRYNIGFSGSDLVTVMKMLDTTLLENYKSGNEYNIYYKLFYALRKIIIENEKQYLITLFNDYKKFERTASKNKLYAEYMGRKLLRALGNLAAFEPGFEKLWFEIRKTETERDLLHIYPSYFILRDYLVGILPAFYNKEISWAEKFSVKYLKKMSPEQAAEAKTFTDANIHYLKGKYDEALNCASRITSKDYQVGLLIKILQMKIYFELGEYERAYSIIDAYNHYIKENKYISGEIDNRHSPFVKYFKQLVKAAEKNNKDVFEMNLAALNKTEFFDRIWLINAYNNILKNGK